MSKKNGAILRYKDLLDEHRQELQNRYYVNSMGLFGSRLRGEERTDSDLDILITFSKTPGLLQFVALQEHLSDMLGVKVDLVMRDSLKPHIGREILKEVVSV